MITSPTGAALQDILTTVRQRFPYVQILVAESLMQGSGAPADIARAIERLNAMAGIDLIIVARGGGSLEDLAPFNTETAVSYTHLDVYKRQSLTIDGKRIYAAAGTTILEAARKSGIEIPTLCYHPRLRPLGHCRLCLVEVEGLSLIHIWTRHNLSLCLARIRRGQRRRPGGSGRAASYINEGNVEM